MKKERVVLGSALEFLILMFLWYTIFCYEITLYSWLFTFSSPLHICHVCYLIRNQVMLEIQKRPKAMKCKILEKRGEKKTVTISVTRLI